MRLHRPLGSLLAFLAVVMLPAVAEAQERPCRLRSFESVDRRGDAGTVYIVRPDFVCEGGTEIRAAEATLFEHLNQVNLTGNVFYRDLERELTSEHATYNTRSGRLHARENVIFVDRVEGSTLRGPDLEYFRAMEGRPEAQMLAIGRPRLTVQPKPGDGTGTRDPVEIVGDQISSRGQDRISAVGRVEIRGNEMDASARHADMERASDRLHLRGDARVRSDRFTAGGEEIDVRFPGGAMEHLRVLRAASLEGDDLHVEGDEIQVFFEHDEVSRLVSRRGESSRRAVATARAFRIEADSVDAEAPGQRLRRVVAIGGARTESLEAGPEDRERPLSPDMEAFGASPSVLPDPLARAPVTSPQGEAAAGDGGQVAIDRDWMTGDTIVATFADDEEGTAPPAAEGEENRPVLEKLLATGTAASLYRVQRSTEPGAGPGLNYLSGDIIELTFQGDKVDLAKVSGLKQGVYLEADVGTPSAAPVDGEPLDSAASPVSATARRGGP
jgi:lipopolysaccharide export system protein LptA